MEPISKEEELAFHREEVSHLISYAVKEGFLSEEEAERMTWDDKEEYYDRSVGLDASDFEE
jgi:polyhydroxyalkanoate synthesis regulator phasin